MPEAVAAVLGIAQQAGLSVAESVAAALEGRKRLLVFDNCEHVLDAAADMIGSILQHSATVTIVATSREGLRLADEQLWPVPSLEVRNSADSAAPVLFVERAGAVAPGISLAGADTEELVVEICRRLDGIPLAIELAASRMQSMTATNFGIGSMTGSGCWWGHAADWSATKLCATPCSGPMTYSMTPKRRCLQSVRCLQAGST